MFVTEPDKWGKKKHLFLFFDAFVFVNVTIYKHISGFMFVDFIFNLKHNESKKKKIKHATFETNYIQLQHQNERREKKKKELHQIHIRSASHSL